jgi:hypothetical protein
MARILAASEEARDHLVPFMSDLNDVRKLLGERMSASTVALDQSHLSARPTGTGEDVRESLMDVEKELDRGGR